MNDRLSFTPGKLYVLVPPRPLFLYATREDVEGCNTVGLLEDCIGVHGGHKPFMVLESLEAHVAQVTVLVVCCATGFGYVNVANYSERLEEYPLINR